MSNVFDSIRSLVPKRSRHILKDYHSFDMDYMKLVPFYVRDCVPGDNFKLYLEDMLREKPLIAPVQGRKDLVFRFFFVAYRNLDPNFEKGITGGDDGEFKYTFPSVVNSSFTSWFNFFNATALYTPWDYFGFPSLGGRSSHIENLVKNELMPSAYPFLAYFNIWNEFFRDEDLQSKVPLLEYNNNGILKGLIRSTSDYKCLPVCYKRDYFTSAALTPQKGPQMTFPISGVLPVQSSQFDIIAEDILNGKVGSSNPSVVGIASGNVHNIYKNRTSPMMSGSETETDVTHVYDVMGVDLADSVTFSVEDMRKIVQIQKIYERLSRTGSRYNEFLKSFFSVDCGDSRLQRPEYIGGYTQPIVNGEVLQTGAGTGSNTDSVGALKGRGISASSTFIGKYFVREYGCIMGVCFVRPHVLYTQGINRQWQKHHRFDFYYPQLCNLGEQAILNSEIFVDSSDNEKIWGYQGNWSEMRTGFSVVSGAMRTDLNYWNYGRYFNSRPNLNNAFVSGNSSDWQRFYNEQTTPPFYVETEVRADVVRPITAYPEPGRMDHEM